MEYERTNSSGTLKVFRPVSASEGMVCAMNDRGAVVIPKAYRKALNIDDDDSVEMLCYKDGIFIRPVKKP